ncbi:DUF6916 family protein [Dokdonella immobilis]|uniref:DUF6916 domain-containing protein n=1 Tax=Dokdonella immobilis TaxID=578942 RepID=A0A1I4ZJS3_9GAMM|nr:hypothetical protein [Dokdonella immobilis]SFN50515.1 hypothetical protein SAMN05216289_12648 [Dokdonella immobilis]
MFDLSQLNPEHFESLVGSELPIVDSHHAFTLKAVARLKSPSPRGEPFALTLAAPAATRGTQGLYRLQHPQLGTLEVFLVPIAPVDGQALFEAVFN